MIAEIGKEESLKNYCEHCEGHTDKDKCAEHCVFKKYKEVKHGLGSGDITKDIQRA